MVSAAKGVVEGVEHSAARLRHVVQIIVGCAVFLLLSVVIAVGVLTYQDLNRETLIVHECVNQKFDELRVDLASLLTSDADLSDFPEKSRVVCPPTLPEGERP